jgi:hypothetical protein
VSVENRYIIDFFYESVETGEGGGLLKIGNM